MKVCASIILSTRYRRDQMINSLERKGGTRERKDCLISFGTLSREDTCKIQRTYARGKGWNSERRDSKIGLRRYKRTGKKPRVAHRKGKK